MKRVCFATLWCSFSFMLVSSWASAATAVLPALAGLVVGVLAGRFSRPKVCMLLGKERVIPHRFCCSNQTMSAVS